VGGSGTGAAAAPFVFSPCCSWDTSNFSYNPYNTTNIAGAMNDFVTMPLAIQKYPSLTDYIPQLASSWKASGRKLTVNLNPKARWEDGTKVTSKDVYDTVLLNGLNGGAAWSDITGVKIVDDTSLAFTLRKGQPVALAENDILGGTYPVASSVYGKFVTAQVEKDVPAYYAEYNSDPDKAAKMAAYKRNGAAFQKLAAFDPKKLTGDGPFKLTAASGAEAKLVKSNSFWLADKIKVPGITFDNMSNEQIYPQLFAGSLDLSTVYLTPPLTKKWQETSGAHTAVPQSFGYVLGFNNARYPLNITAVRRALAYVIPRKAMTDAAFGTAEGGGAVWQQYQTGLSEPKNTASLTPAQLKKLNAYNPDKAKATELLKGVGFTQKAGQWYTPKGKRFTLSLEANSATSNVVTSFTSAAKALSGFGIKSDVDATSGAQLSADEMNGNFQIGQYSPNGNTSLQMLSSMLHDNNFQTSGNYTGKKGMGFGPTADVPGQGTVNVATTIYNQARSTGPGAKQNKLTWDWARLVNQQVPYILYATKRYQFEFTDTHYTNWPPLNSGTSRAWDMMGNIGFGTGLLYAMEQGYIEPK
jgi:peptide/nickel transport system substrate-binding protein